MTGGPGFGSSATYTGAGAGCTRLIGTLRLRGGWVVANGDGFRS